LKYTENYNLKKPEGSDVVNIEDLNDNADIIDQTLKAHDDALATKETPEGAQEKADAALNSAKQYTDQEVGEVAQELAAHKADVENRIDNPEYSSEQVVTGGIGNLPENLVEGQINDAIIEGLTAINLVKNGNFSNSTTNWYTDGANLSVSSNMMNVKGNGSSKYCFLGQKISTSVAGKKYFLRAKVRVTNSQCTRIVLYGYSDNNIRADAKTLNSPVQNQEYSLYGIADFSNGTGAFSLLMYHEYADASTATDKIMEVKEVFVKELTGEDLALTADQINLKYLHWFDGTKSVPASLRIKTIGKNLYDPSKARLGTINSSGQIISSDSNVISDYIKIKPNTSYKFSVQNSNYVVNGFILYDNQKRYIRSGTITGDITDSNAGYVICRFRKSDSSVMTLDDVEKAKPMLEEGPTVTEYEEYKESIQYISAKDSQGNLIELRSLPNGVKDAINTQKNKLIKRVSDKVILHGNLEWAVSSVNDNRVVVMLNVPSSGLFPNAITWNSDIAKNSTIFGYNSQDVFSSLGIPRGISFMDQILYIAIPIPFGTLQDAKNYLNNDPVTMYYQLETPQEINFNIEGVLQAFENGTIEITPYLKEEFSITGISINLSKPISAIDKIEILQNNVWTEATGTLSSDGKTIMVSSSWKYRVFGSIKSEESLIPEVTYTVPVNLKAQVDSNTKAVTAINKRMIDLNDKVNILSDYDTFKQDIKGYIGYTENDIVGVEADFVNNKFTRLAGAVNKNPGADFDSIKAFGGRKRCILTDDGVVLAYYGEPGYVETGKLTQAITKNSVTYPVGTPVQVMVEQPKFYYKVVPLQLEPITDGIGYHLRKARYYVSDTPKAGFKVHPAFIRNGVVKDKIYLSAYEGSIYDVSAGTYLLNDEQIADFDNDKLSSIAGAKPASGLTQNLTRANTRKLANNRGAGWQLSDVLSASVTQMLFIIEYASFNTQANIGLGVVKKADGEGNESEITGATTNLGNASGMADGTNGLVSVTYRGEENFWGNIWYWVDGLNIEIGGGVLNAWYTDYGFTDDIKTSPYKNTGFTLAKGNGYVSAIGWSETCDFLFLPTETLGNSSLPIGDYFYRGLASPGWRVPLLGGLWRDGSAAGGFYWNLDATSAGRSREFGGRLLYVPQS